MEKLILAHYLIELPESGLTLELTCSPTGTFEIDLGFDRVPDVSRGDLAYLRDSLSNLLIDTDPNRA